MYLDGSIPIVPGKYQKIQAVQFENQVMEDPGNKNIRMDLRCIIYG
jgi:hypothetical protein